MSAPHQFHRASFSPSPGFPKSTGHHSSLTSPWKQPEAEGRLRYSMRDNTHHLLQVGCCNVCYPAVDLLLGQLTFEHPGIPLLNGGDALHRGQRASTSESAVTPPFPVTLSTIGIQYGPWGGRRTLPSQLVREYTMGLRMERADLPGSPG